MSSYQDFTTTRQTQPDFAALMALIRAIDPAAGACWLALNQFRLKKPAPWTAAQISAAQGIIDTAPVTTPLSDALAAIDAMSIFQRSILLTLLDQINMLRALLPIPLQPVTPAQMATAVRSKAGQL